MDQHRARGHVVACTDVMGRDRVLRVVRQAGGRVGIQRPPGEYLELTPEQLHALTSIARVACRDSWHHVVQAVDGLPMKVS
jgi:hypothetical protein